MGDGLFSLICNKVSNTKEALLGWSKSKFGRIKEEITATRAQLASFYFSFSAPPTETRVSLEAKLSKLLFQEQSFWQQRAKVF